jgi:hypothetical protein
MNKNRIAVICAAAFAALYMAGIMWGMPSEFVSEIDSEFPSGPFNILAHFHDNGYTSNYPVFHKLLLLPFYAVLVLMFKITGQFTSFLNTWPYGFNDPVAAMTAMIIATRCVSIVMGTGTILILGLFACRLSENMGIKNRLFIFCPVVAFGLSGVVAYYSQVSNYDIPQLFWWSLSLFFLWNFFTGIDVRKRHLVLSALFAALAVATKDQTVFFIAGSSLLLFMFPNAEKPGRRAKNFMTFSLFAMGFYLAAAVLVQPFHWISHLKQVLFLNITSGRFAVYSGSAAGQISLFMECLRCLSHIIAPWGIVLGAAGMATIIAKRKWQLLALIGFPALSAYVLIFARIHFVFERYMLNYAFLFTLAAAAGIRILIDSLPTQKLRYVRPVLAVIIGSWLIYQMVFSFVPVTCAKVFDTKKQLSVTLPALVPAGDTIGWQGSRFSLPNAKIYTRYRFAVPDSVYDSLHSTRMGHVLVRSSGKRTWVLSDRDLLTNNGVPQEIAQRNWIDTTGLKLIARINDPPFVRNNIKVYTAAQRVLTFRVSIPYYIYKRH